MFELTLYGFVVGSAIFFLPTRLDGDEIYCFYGIAFIAILSFFCRPVREINLKRMAFIPLYALLTLPFNFFWPERGVFINLFFWFVTLRFTAERIKMTPENLGKTFTAILFIQYVFIILQWLKMEPIYSMVYPEIAGTMLLPWMLGCLAVIALPFIFQFNPALAILVFPLLVLSKSWFCLALGGVIYFLMIGTTGAAVAFALCTFPVITYFIFSLDGAFNIDRVDVWIESTTYIKSWWIGNGIGSWPHMGFLKLNGADTYHWQWAHNELYQYFFEQGRLGLIALVPFVSWLSRAHSRVLKVSLLGIFLLAMVHPVFHFGRLLCPIFIVLAMILAERGTPWLRIKSA